MTKNPFGFIRYPGSTHLFISGCWTGYVTGLDYGLSWVACRLRPRTDKAIVDAGLCY